jgi:hypothetical protein
VVVSVSVDAVVSGDGDGHDQVNAHDDGER